MRLDTSAQARQHDTMPDGSDRSVCWWSWVPDGSRSPRRRSLIGSRAAKGTGTHNRELRSARNNADDSPQLNTQCGARRTLGSGAIVSLRSLIMTIVGVGMVLWLINTLPIQARTKRILITVVVIGVIIWLLNVFGLMGPLT